MHCSEDIEANDGFDDDDDVDDEIEDDDGGTVVTGLS